MSNSAEVATAGAGDSTSSSLTEAQLSAFWAGIVANLDAARSMAAQFVSRQSVDDVVNTAAILFIEWLERPEKLTPFPKTDDDFRREFLFILRNHAIDCVRGVRVSKKPEPLIHSHWGVAKELVVGGRNVADRELDQVFARNDEAKYDAPAPAERRTEADIRELDRILRAHLLDLPPMQREVTHQTFFDGRKRAEVAARLGISVKTYDCHREAAFCSLRHLLTQDALAFTNIDRSPWYDLIEELRERYDATRLRRAAAKKGKRSTPQGERSTHEGERDKNRGASAA
jgi:RNA polymerase sigma factor (sigma-70 family)